MYQIINKYADKIVDEIGLKFIQKYEWLLNSLNIRDVSVDKEYQKRYNAFWRLRGLDSAYKDAYFKCLEANKFNSNIDAIQVCEFLYSFPTNKKGTKTLQFSFSTKIAHMVNPKLPIYDKMVRNFYHFPESNRSLNFDVRLLDYRLLYNFLIDEYKRILDKNLLAKAIKVFRSELNPKNFSDEKVIDSLIWGFVTLAKNAGIIARVVEYH